MKEITAEELMKFEQPIIIDVRSPIEFMDGAIPGAINVPLFSDEERKEVGTLYKHEGTAIAKWRAMEIVSPRIPDLLKTIKALSSGGEELVIHCWRGGQRSKAVVSFLEFSGIYSWKLIDGYKGFRTYILQQISKMFPDKAVVLHGLTGVGKTEVLKILKEKGFPILDLEEMAGHRGSIFGTIGIGDGHNQKTFDGLLFKGLKEIQGSAFFLIEAESKRIGKTVQPEELMEKKMNGINIQIHTPLKQRVKQLVLEYVLPYEQEPWYYDQIAGGIERVLRRVKDSEIRKELIQTLADRNYPKMIQLLLEYYYDPLYDHATKEYEGEFINIFAENPLDAAKKIAQQLDILGMKRSTNFENQF